jgi:hypothetical protein
MPVAGDTHDEAKHSDGRGLRTSWKWQVEIGASRSSDRPAFCFAFSIHDGLVTGNVISKSADARWFMSDSTGRERYFVCDGEDCHLVSSQKEAEELCETSLRMYAEEAASDGEWSSDVDGGIYWGIVAGKSMLVFGFEDVDNGETIDIIETVDFKMIDLPPIVEEN